MTTDAPLIRDILAENEKRLLTLSADYNPITGEGLPDRARIEIPDFAIPVQFVPKKMAKNKLVVEILKAGSIAAFLKKHPNDPKIQNEHDIELELRRVRHRYDFEFWAYFCFPIISKTGGAVRFKLNRPQQELDVCVQRDMDNGDPIYAVVCKARQWGGSTYCIARQSHILLELDNFHSFAVAAHVNGAAENILRMLKYAIARYPAWDLGLPEDEKLELLPAGKSGNAYAIKDSHGNQVIPGLIYIGSAQNPESLRSPAVRGGHYSEICVWPDTPEKRSQDLIATITGGMLGLPLEMQVYESTAKSSDDYFHDLYLDAKNRNQAVFIPWYHIPHDTLAIKDKTEFAKWLTEHRNDDKTSGKWKDSGKHYWWLWTLGASLEGINWYRNKRLQFLSYSQMANEAPSTDIEAFQASGSHVFDIYQVEAMRKYCRPPYKVGRLVSKDRRGSDVLRDIRFIEQANGNLMIWEMPDDTPVSNRYIVVVDIGGPNPTSDFHSVRVMDRLMMMPEFNGKPNVVAEMHYHCLRDELAYDAMRLAEWYGHAKLVIESNTYEMTDRNRNPEGDGSQYILDVCGEIYSNLYCRETPADKISEDAPSRWGFQTNARTKPMIIDFAQWCISEQAWDEPNPQCLDEFSMYIEDRNKFTAPPHKHDDILMATCIMLFVSFREMPLPRWIDKDGKKKVTAEENTIANF